MAKLFERLNELRDLINEAEKEPSMKPYWMVHRYGRQSGPASKVHHSFEDAYKEAERLTRRENDRFIILQAHTLIKPYEPLVVVVETIGDSFPYGPPEDTLPSEVPCGYGCNDTEVSSNCEVHAEPKPCPASLSGRMADCTCSKPHSDIVTPIPTQPNCPCPACTTGVVRG